MTLFARFWIRLGSTVIVGTLLYNLIVPLYTADLFRFLAIGAFYIATGMWLQWWYKRPPKKRRSDNRAPELAPSETKRPA